MLNPILLVEDSPDDAELTIAALALDIAARVVHVPDGKQALDWLHRRGSHAQRPLADPVVILLDLKLPLIDGLTVLREVRRTPALRKIPVVGLTSAVAREELDQAYQEGINACVIKPADFTEFVETMKCVGQFWVMVNQVAEPN